MKMFRPSPLLSSTRWFSLALLTLLMTGSVEAQFTLDREPPGPSSRKTGLAITEIMYNPRAVVGQATNNTLEFIEVFNSKPWDENISGFSIGGAVTYVFPSNTVLRAGAYLVVARVPGLIVTNYGVTNVFGPWNGAATNRLPTERGLVQLRNRQGAVLLAINYQDSPPWSEAADGTGHSLSLVRPSYGEDDFRAWAESDSVGGSPGRAEPVTHDPLASIFINEFQNHSDPSDWIELYNHSNVDVDLSGAWLSDDPLTNKFPIPNGTIIPARGFRTWDQNQLGFELFAGGETIFLWNSNQTRVIDVIDFRGASNNVSQGRVPDGGANLYGMASNTRGNANSGPMRYGVIINEIMFNPISGDNADEYVEIYNRGSSAVNLQGWEFVTGIGYTFPTNAITSNMPPGAHWVIAQDPASLALIYTNLSTNSNLFGPYTGTLANGGERLTLASADYDIVQGPGGSTVEKLNVPVSDLIYGDGGKWGNWSDGLGSSLELIDPDADAHYPSSWADSNDTGESKWTAIEFTGPVGETLGTPVNDRLIFFLQGIGECLVDEVEVRVDNGPNLVANGGFESGLNDWSLQGSHDFSTIENEGFAGAKSLHLRAGSRGDNQSNRLLSAPLAGVIPPDAQNVSIRAKVRWLRGFPEFMLRLHGSATEAYGRMSLPRRLGSPGMVNSRRVPNAGPAVHDVKHFPIVPAAGQAVVVSTQAIDRQGPLTMTLRYRVDPTPTYTGVTMRDNGTGGDAIPNDGIFSATIPGQDSGLMVAFFVEGKDGEDAIGTFPQDVFPPAGLTRCWPNDAVARECVVRWGEVQMPGDFATYHLWVTAANSNRWHHRDTQNNTSMDATFIYNNYRAIYNALPLYSGSPWHRTNATTGPAGINRVDYEMNFPDDDALLGATDFVLNNPGNPDILTISDLSAVAEQTVYRIFEGLGLVHNHRRLIHFFVNGSQRSTAYERPGNFIFEDSQQPNGDVISQWFPNDGGGQLFKVEDWFEFENNGFDISANNDADLARRTVLIDGQPTFLPGPYRFMFRKRSVGVGNSANDFTQVYELINAASPAESPNSTTVDPDLLSTAVDWEAWMRHFAVQRTVGNWDSFGWERGKNDYLYRTANGFVHMPWDIDYSLGLGRPPNEPLFASNDPRIAAMFNTPAIVRAYWRAFADIVNGPFNNATLDPFIDERTAALAANNVNFDPAAVTMIKNYITDRRAFLMSQLATVTTTFAVDGPPTFSSAENLLTFTGTAPIEVKTILFNGASYPIVWTSATNFMFRVVLQPGVNTLTLQGLDRFGVAIPTSVSVLNVDYTGPVADPVGALVINEIMATPATTGAQFIEIVNRSTHNFDLAGWSLDGANLTFPAGSIVTNGQILLLARNRNAFNAAHGNLPLFAVFGANLSTAGQALALLKPEAGGALIVDGVSYETGAPWPAAVTGGSLQLIDLAQDNSRPSNWAVDATGLATPGALNSVAATLPAYDALWLNEVQIDSLNGPLDNFGEREPWLELYNAGAVPLNLANYFLATSYTNNLFEWNLPAVAIAPGEHLLIWADAATSETEGANIHTSFRLDLTGKLALVRAVAGQPQITDSLAWRQLGANVSYGSAPDGQSVFRMVLHQPSPGATNHEPAVRLFINEWMASNTGGIRDPADQAQDDWIELFNAGTTAIDLSGFHLTDDLLNPTKYRVPTNGQYRVAPGGYFLVWADNQTNQNTATRADLHTNFKLGASAGSIGLYARDGVTPIDTLDYLQQTADISEGRYSDGAVPRYAMPKPTPRGTNGIPDYNTAPRFPAIGNQSLLPGQTVTLTIRVLDPDVPPQVITYSFDTEVPAGTALNQGGAFRWIVPTNQAPGDYLISIRAFDNGVPPRSDLLDFTITVRPPNGVPIGTPPPLLHSVAGPGGQITFTIDTILGRSYRVYYKDDLAAEAWTQLDRDFVAANETASLTDTLASPQRFYRVQQVD